MSDNGVKPPVKVKKVRHSHEGSLTAGRNKIFVKNIWGKYQKRRWLVFAFFTIMFYTLPWMRWDGHPLVLLDLPMRKFHIMGITLWPQDVYLLTLTLITAAISLFFSSALINRVWCGYLCPQTVFTSIFIEVERLVLGDSVKQERISKGPMNAQKIKLLMTRNLLWGGISFSAGFTFLSYFMPNTEIIERVLNGQMSGWSLFFLLFISGFAFFDFGFFREQFCFVPCPYGRFQGALQDPNSLVITYDKERGESTDTKKGDCIDCDLCHVVCPTGIDIRNGAQFECISCARCIDACAVVQTKQKKSPDLIKYASYNEMNHKPSKIVRPRLIFYIVLITFFVSFIAYNLVTRKGFDFQSIRDRNSVYQVLGDGRVSNAYEIKISNMTNDNCDYTLKVDGIDAELVLGEIPIKVKTGDTRSTSVLLLEKTSTSPQKVKDFNFVLVRKNSDGSSTEITKRNTFISP